MVRRERKRERRHRGSKQWQEANADGSGMTVQQAAAPLGTAREGFHCQLVSVSTCRLVIDENTEKKCPSERKKGKRSRSDSRKVEDTAARWPERRIEQQAQRHWWANQVANHGVMTRPLIGTKAGNAMRASDNVATKARSHQARCCSQAPRSRQQRRLAAASKPLLWEGERE